MKVKMEQPNELLVDDLESLLRDINDFTTGSANNKSDEIPSTLENYLLFVARTGNTVFPWQHIRTLFRVKMISAINQFGGESSATEAFVLERFDLFRAAPFTIQRFTELITQPNRHYKKKEKFLRGLEKTVLVVSTIEPKPVRDDVKNGNENSNSSGDADADTDQGFSEGDEPTNRTFLLDRSLEHEDLVTSAGCRGDLNSVAGSSGMDNVSSTNLASTSAIAAASKALADSLQQVTGIETCKIQVTEKMTELYRSYVDANDSVTTVASSVASQVKVEATNAIIDVVSVNSEQHSVLRDGAIEFESRHQHRVNLVEITSSGEDFNVANNPNLEVTDGIDENGNPPKVAAEVCDAISAIEQSSTPMEVDEDVDTSSTTLYTIESESIGIPILEDMSSAAPPVIAAPTSLEKEDLPPMDEEIPVASELSTVVEPILAAAAEREEMVTEFVASAASSTTTNLDVTSDNVIVSEGQEFTELKSQISTASGNALEYESENRLVELNTAVIQTTSSETAAVHFNAEVENISEPQLSTPESQYSNTPLQDPSGISPAEGDQGAVLVDGTVASAPSTDLVEEN